MPLTSAADAAILTALNLHRKGIENGRPINRARLSERTLRRITGRRRLDGRFLEDFGQELLELGWVIMRTHMAWGVQRATAVMGWHRINSSRIGPELVQAGNGDLEAVILRARTELGLVDDQPEEEEAED